MQKNFNEALGFGSAPELRVGGSKVCLKPYITLHFFLYHDALLTGSCCEFSSPTTFVLYVMIKPYTILTLPHSEHNVWNTRIQPCLTFYPFSLF